MHGVCIDYMQLVSSPLQTRRLNRSLVVLDTLTASAGDGTVATLRVMSLEYVCCYSCYIS